MWQMFTNGCYYWFSTSLGLFWLCQTSNHPEASPLTACLHHTHDSFAFSHCDISHTYSYKECHKTGFRAWKCFTETDEPLNISQSATSSEWKGLPWRAPHLWDLYSRLRNGKKKKISWATSVQSLTTMTPHTLKSHRSPRALVIQLSHHWLRLQIIVSSREVKCYIPSQVLKKMMNWKIHGKRL